MFGPLILRAILASLVSLFLATILSAQDQKLSHEQIENVIRGAYDKVTMYQIAQRRYDRKRFTETNANLTKEGKSPLFEIKPISELEVKISKIQIGDFKDLLNEKISDWIPDIRPTRYINASGNSSSSSFSDNEGNQCSFTRFGLRAKWRKSNLTIRTREAVALLNSLTFSQSFLLVGADLDNVTRYASYHVKAEFEGVEIRYKALVFIRDASTKTQKEFQFADMSIRAPFYRTYKNNTLPFGIKSSCPSSK